MEIGCECENKAELQSSKVESFYERFIIINGKAMGTDFVAVVPVVVVVGQTFSLWGRTYGQQTASLEPNGHREATTAVAMRREERPPMSGLYLYRR